MAKYVRKMDVDTQNVIALALENKEYEDVIESVDVTEREVRIILTDGRTLLLTVDEDYD